jgi:electron transport complex protein RnfE
MAEKQSKWRIFTAGIIRENPVLRLVLGCCSALAVTTTVRRFGHGPGHDVRSGLL